jgi:exopolyphosphatase/guanosine-5'-triphosphate,3'-diphosphate pyrophosphatase
LLRGCIDIGSNTTRLLVADCSGGDLVERCQQRVFTRIGRSLDARGAIPEQKLEEVAGVVAAQRRTARELGVESLRCVATAAVRRAANSAVLAELIWRRCGGLEMEVLTGEQEARLAFVGATWAARPEPHARVAVVDAGGGSTELVVGTIEPGRQPRGLWWESVPIGSSDVTTRWLRSDPPTVAELESARQEVAALFVRLRPPADVHRAIAVGGSATSLRAVAGDVLEPAALGLLAREAANATASELAARFSVDPQRAELLVGGLLILAAASTALGASLEVGGGGLREGVLLSDQLAMPPAV